MSSSPLNFPSPSLFMHVSYKKRAHELINMARELLCCGNAVQVGLVASPPLL